MRWKVLGLIVFAILIAGFTLANTTEVTVNFVVASAKTNLVLVILLAVFLGMILMAILWSLRAWKLRGQLGTLKKQLAQAQSELAKYKPVEDENGSSENGNSDVETEGTDSSTANSDELHNRAEQSGANTSGADSEKS